MNIAMAFQGIVILLWIIFIGLIALAVTRAYRGQPVKATSTALIVSGVLAAVATSVSAGLVFIEPQERGVVISAMAPRGYREEAFQPGLRWKIPFLEYVELYPISRQTYTISSTSDESQAQGDASIAARTSDGQEVFVDASIIYAINPDRVTQVHIEWQDRYPNDLVRPLARGVIRDAISQFGVEEVYSTQRMEMTRMITEDLQRRMDQNGLTLVEFVLRNITFSPEYAASVEQKQIAEQQAQQAAFVVEQRRQEAEQARQVAQGRADSVVIEAQGDADARLIQAEAEAQALEKIAAALLDNQDLLTYTYINKIAPGVQVMLVPNNSPYLLPLPEVGPPVAEATAQQPAVVAPTPTPDETEEPAVEPTPTP